MIHKLYHSKAHYAGFDVAEPGDTIIFRIPYFKYNSTTKHCKFACGEVYNEKEKTWALANLPWEHGASIIIENVDLREKENDPRAGPIHIYHFYLARDDKKNLYRFVDSLSGGLLIEKKGKADEDCKV